MLADSFLHHFDPFAIRFTEHFGIRWYGLSYAAGFILGWLVVRWMAATGRSTLAVRDVADMMFAVILGVLVGGRLGYAIFYDPHLLIDFFPSFPWWGLLAINKGGMASHGGIAGVIIALTIFGRMRKVSIPHMLDLAAYVSTIGLCLGRVANFINAELWGKPLPDSRQSYVPASGLTGIDPPWWSVKYPEEVTEVWLKTVNAAPMRAPAAAHDAQQRLDALAQQLSGVVGGDGTAFHRIVELAKDQAATDHAPVVAALKPMLTAYYPSQLIQAITDGPMLLGALTLLWLRPRKPGVIGSWFLIAYSLLRVASEVFRQPDEGVALTLGLSRGQLLSVLMFAVGCVCLWISTQRNVPKVGGLLRPQP